MGQGAAAAGGDDRDIDGPGHGPGHSQIKAPLGPVGIHGGQQDLSRAQPLALLRPPDRVDAGGLSAAGHHYLIAAVLPAPGVDG